MKPFVITCFAGIPDYEALSPFAADQHQRWGLPDDPVGERRREDVAALGCLGAKYQHWDEQDCIYRRSSCSGQFLYTSEESLFDDVRSEENGLVGVLAQRIMASIPSEGTHIYAPLAVGHHVDHQLVLQAAFELQRAGYAVRYYEDYPYAEDSRQLEQALLAWDSPPLPYLQLLGEESMTAKVAAISLYRSQIDNLFGCLSSMPTRVITYALMLGAGRGYAERYWEEGTFCPATCS
jgi:LmbE family N-acetylglucosaminyl deacetylase